ncbi:MAG: helix-turn-helix transcriptional regulator [Nitrospirae bacterium]|nr:helix-turn-helix transcriptional regulator [Nitrospirota bacterium]
MSDLEKIRKLVGTITKEQLRYVDSFIGEDIGIFMPIGGPCFYAMTPMHNHPSYMFVLPFNDQTSININGKIITAKHGKLFALSPDIVHHECPSDYSPRYIAIFVDKGFFEKQLSQYPIKQGIVFHGESYDVAPNLLPLLKRFMIEADNKMSGSEAVLHGLSLEICHTVIRSIFNFIPDNDRISSRIEIDRVVEYLHSNLDKKITVEVMAKIAYMSPSHFARIFKQEIGTSPVDYLNQIRMEMAKKLLLAGDKSITEIALKCGFNSSSYLSACFYKRYKITPSEYQNSLKNGSISKNHSRILKV